MALPGNNKAAAGGPEAAVEEFAANLRAMATGSYLREEDKEFWEAPYPESAVGEARDLAERMVASARAAARLGATPSSGTAGVAGESGAHGQELEGSDDERIAEALVPEFRALLTLSGRYGDALIEDEEIEDLRVIVRALAEETGADAAVLIGRVDEVLDEA